jgi:hypothetical protein
VPAESSLAEQAQTQEQRIAANEALFRRANELLRLRYEELRLDSERLPFICECGDETCTRTLTLTLDEYRDVRRHSHHYVVVPGHELAASEDVVEEEPDYSIVEKHTVEG